MSEIIILVGEGRAGKTTYAKNYAAETNYSYLTIDGHYDYSGEQKYLEFLNYIADTLNNNPNANFILDGYLDYDDHFKYLKAKLMCHKIKAVLIYGDAETIRSRGKGGAVRINTRDEIIASYERFKTKWDFDEMRDSTNKYKKIDNYDMVMEKVKELKESNPTEEDVKNFLEDFEQSGQEKYHSIDLPFGYRINGYCNEEEHCSWAQISQIYDFKDKKCADMGCFHGFFSFEMKKQAKEVHGFDYKHDALVTAVKIAKLKELKIRFRKFDMNTDKLNEQFDVILLLNALHHVKEPRFALEQVFSKGKCVILEVQFDGFTPDIQTGWKQMVENTEGWSKELLISIAKEYGHELKEDFTSHRGRTIVKFEKC